MSPDLRWTDVAEITFQLVEAYPDVDPKYVSFPDLYGWILALLGFSDDPARCNERVLEAIQGAWLAELA
jgi:FeS assembly protein IscX